MTITYLKQDDEDKHLYEVEHDGGLSKLRKTFPDEYLGGYKIGVVRGKSLSDSDYKSACASISSMKFFDIRPKPIKKPFLKDHKVKDMVLFPDGTVKRVVLVNGKKTFSRLSELLNEADAVLNRVATSNTKGNPLLKVARSELMQAYQSLCDEAEMIIHENEAA